MIFRRHLLAACLCLAATAAQAQASAPAATDPLFGQLGGKPGIAALMDDFVPRLYADARIGAFFKETNQRELRKQLVDQVCAVSGGPCVYEGNDMKAAHEKLNIGKADFNRMVELLQVSMDTRAIPFADQNRLLARLAPMHRDVITAR